MNRNSVLLVLAVVLIGVAASVVVLVHDTEVSSYEKDPVDFRPESNLDPFTDSNVTDSGNGVQTRLLLERALNGWELGQRYEFSLADGYRLDYLRVTTTLPDGAEFYSYQPDEQNPGTTVVLTGVVVNTEYRDGGAVTTFMYGRDTGQEIQAIDGPTAVFSSQLTGPVTVSYEAVFSSGSLMTERQEFVRGSVVIWTDDYEATYPWGT